MKKIMFNDKYGLTKAVLEGRKTQTRRIAMHSDEDAQVLEEINLMDNDRAIIQYVIDKYSRYKNGEIIAIAQCYLKIMDYYHSLGKVSERKVSEQELIFWNAMRIMESTGDDSAMRGDDNKMFVKADLMPHQIRITNIRLERLQDISDEDCVAEGIRKWENEKEYASNETVHKSVDELKAAGYDAYAIPESWDCYTSPQKAYAALIDKVSGKGTWEKNPWVFVYDFELVK